MSALTLPTLILALSKKDDYELRQYARSEIGKDIGEKAANVLAETARDGVRKLDDGQKRETYQRLLEAGLEPVVADTVLAGYSDAVKINVDEGFPIESIMEMFHNEDSFLVRKSKEYVIISYSMFVYKIIHTYYAQYVPKYTEDLYQSGCAGLLKAMNGYDPKNGAFTTYSQFFVRHEMTDQANFYKGGISPHYSGIQRKIKDAREKLRSQGYEATDMQVSIVTGLKLDVIRKEDLYIERSGVLSLDDEENKLEIGYGYDEDPDIAIGKKTKYENLYSSLMDLPEDIRTILVMRTYRYTNDQIAQELGINATRVKSRYQRGLLMMARKPALRAAYMETLSEADRMMMRFNVDLKLSQKSAEEQLEATMAAMGDLPPLCATGSEDIDLVF